MLKKESGYTLRLASDRNMYDTSSIVSLYGPLIGEGACILYLALLEQSSFSLAPKNHNYICSVTNFSPARLEGLRGELESYLLLKTYYNPNDESYIYDLCPPLQRDEFLQHDVFGRLYQQRMGIELYSFLSQQNKVNVEEGYEEVSKSLQVDFYKQWKPSDEELFSNAKPLKAKEIAVHMEFDYNEFLVISNMVFPKQARTRENLQEIGRIANLYGIKASDMRKLVAKSFDIADNTLDKEKLEYMAKKNMPQATLPTDIYEASPYQFLQYKQNGVPIADSDHKLIDDLLVKYKLPSTVVNVLIEFTLRMTGQKFNRSYVEKVATTWVRQGVDTKELAIAATQQQSNPYAKGAKKESSLPEWYYEESTTSSGEEDEIAKDLEEAFKILGGN